MSDSLTRFTPRARRVLRLAQEAAQEHHHDQIEPEHLLVALARDADATSVTLLRSWGVEPGQVIRAVGRVVQQGERVAAVTPMPTAQTKRIIEQAVAEARQRQDATIGTEHLLWGLVRADDGVAGCVLQALGVDAASLRSRPPDGPYDADHGDEAP